MIVLILFGMAMTTMGGTIEIHGHRGARAVLPENTIPGFEYTIVEGADWFEIDLWVTKDNQVVVAHDPSMNAQFCVGPEGAEKTIRRMTFAELKRWDCGAKANPGFPRQKALPGTRVPSFAEVLELAKRRKARINVEIKSDPKKPELQPAPAEYARLVVDEIKKHGMAGQVMIQSFDWRLLPEVAKLAAAIPRSALYPTSSAETGLDFVEIASGTGAKMVSVHYMTVTPEKVTRAQAAGVKVLAWTANTPDVWDGLVAAKVDGIITDDPAGLRDYLKKRGLR